jgi:hypothetical protein
MICIPPLWCLKSFSTMNFIALANPRQTTIETLSNWGNTGMITGGRMNEAARACNAVKFS